MEAVGLAVGIIALYTACRDGYQLFTTAKAADTEFAAHLREVEIQQSILKAWGFHWQILTDPNARIPDPGYPRQQHAKLSEYLERNRFKAEGVFRTLSALADALSNKEALIKRYGIRFQPASADENGLESASNVGLNITNNAIEEFNSVINEVQGRLSVLKKFKWALKDKDGFKKLVTNLRNYSDSLYRLCPENALDSMNIYFIMECLSAQDSPEALKWTSKLASQHAKSDVESSVREGYELLASTAALKASVNKNKEKGQNDENGIPGIIEDQPQMTYLGKGLALFQDQVVYVEMRDYRGPPPEMTPEQTKNIKRRSRAPYLRAPYLRSRQMEGTRKNSHRMVDIDQVDVYISDEGGKDTEPVEITRPADIGRRSLINSFFNTFNGNGMMKSVCGLDIAGMIDHTEGERQGHCSILYKLPGTIGVQTRDRPAENLKLRAPITLRSILGTRFRGPDRCMLGDRFELARKLVHAVCILHSCGWLHKNIRASSVMFFPEQTNPFFNERYRPYEVNAVLDVSNPILMGYIFSRPDDTRSPMVDQAEASGLKARMGPEKVHSTSGWVPRTRNGRKKLTRFTSINGFDMTTRVATGEGAGGMELSGFTLDYYQHPAKHADPHRRYRHAYDVYSLGILLLEVGLWEEVKMPKGLNLDLDSDSDTDTVDFDIDTEDQYDRRRGICEKYLDFLRWECGNTYADVVLSCLMIDSSDDDLGKASERELCARIVADLDKCRA